MNHLVDTATRIPINVWIATVGVLTLTALASAAALHAPRPHDRVGSTTARRDAARDRPAPPVPGRTRSIDSCVVLLLDLDDARSALTALRNETTSCQTLAPRRVPQLQRLADRLERRLSRLRSADRLARVYTAGAAKLR